MTTMTTGALWEAPQFLALVGLQEDGDMRLLLREDFRNATQAAEELQALSDHGAALLPATLAFLQACQSVGVRDLLVATVSVAREAENTGLFRSVSVLTAPQVRRLRRLMAEEGAEEVADVDARVVAMTMACAKVGEVYVPEPEAVPPPAAPSFCDAERSRLPIPTAREVGSLRWTRDAHEAEANLCDWRLLLECDDQSTASVEYHVHQAVVGTGPTCSFRLRREFAAGMADAAERRSRVCVPAVCFPVFELALDYMYGSPWALGDNDLVPLLELSHLLLMGGLEQELLDSADSAITPFNALAVLRDAVQFAHPIVAQRAGAFLAASVGEMLANDELSALPLELIPKLLQHPDLEAESEEQVLEGVLGLLRAREPPSSWEGEDEGEDEWEEMSEETKRELCCCVRFSFVSAGAVAIAMDEGLMPEDIAQLALVASSRAARKGQGAVRTWAETLDAPLPFSLAERPCFAWKWESGDGWTDDEDGIHAFGGPAFGQGSGYGGSAFGEGGDYAFGQGGGYGGSAFGEGFG